MRNFLARLFRDESGATALEYGIIIALIFLVILSALTAFGGTSSGLINRTMNTLRDGMTG